MVVERLGNTFACENPGIKSFLDFDNLLEADFENRCQYDRDGKKKPNWAENYSKANKALRYVSVKKPSDNDIEIRNGVVSIYMSLARLYNNHISAFKRMKHPSDYPLVSRYDAARKSKKPFPDNFKNPVYSLDDTIKIVNITKSLIRRSAEMVIAEKDYKMRKAAYQVINLNCDLAKYAISLDYSKSFTTEANVLVKGKYQTGQFKKTPVLNISLILLLL